MGTRFHHQVVHFKILSGRRVGGWNLKGMETVVAGSREVVGSRNT